MKKIYCLLMLLLPLAIVVSAQKKTITGKVSSLSTGEPLSGVNILADKQKGGTTTRPDGTYTIQVNPGTVSLIYSFVGYATQTVAIGDKTTIDIQLAISATANDEVVVIGYGTQRKSHLTGAISKFRNERLDELPVSRLDQALQGKIAGVQVQNISSEAGADAKIRIRGISSITASPNPLVVVDGHIIPDGLAFVNMADVESVEVLKDASSAAIYGSRAGAGVIMITTKSGKAEKPRYNVKFSSGEKTAYERYPMMTTTEYTNMLFYEASLKAKDPSITPPTGTAIIANNERAAYIVENVIMGGQGTDWQDQALRSAVARNLQVNVSGGKKDLKYYLSGAYQRDQGLMYHSEYDKYSLRAKMDAQLNKRVKMSFNLNPSYTKRERPSVNYIDFVRFQSFLPVYHTEATAAFVRQSALWPNIKAGDFVQARHFNGRVYSGVMPDGSVWNTTSPTDPFNTANNTPKSVMETRTITGNEYRLQTAGDITVTIVPGLDFKSMGSVYLNYSTGLDFAKRNSNRDGDVNTGTYTNRLTTDMLNENTLTWLKKYRGHTFTVLGGFTIQHTRSNFDQAVGQDYPSDNVTSLNNALIVLPPSYDANGNIQGTYNVKAETGLNSWLGRITYDYKNKYLLSASIRRDGSSYFGPGHKWGTFPAVSAGWALTQEKFMEKINWLNNLKLRLSYGLTGNNRLPNEYPFVDLLYAANYPLGSGTGTSNPGQAPSRTILGNPDITWERTFQFNGGLDISLFNNIVTLTIDAYQSRSEKLLLTQSSMAFTGVPLTYNNIGKLQNRGLEVDVTTNNMRRKNFRWTTSANLSYNRNKLVEFGDESRVLNQGERTELYQNRVGDPFIQFYGYKTDGVWLSQKQIDDARAAGLYSALSNVFVPGGLKLIDRDGNDTIDANDRTVIGSPYPKFSWGITNTLSYKSFDLAFSFQGIQGGQLVNGDPNYNETKRYNRNYNSNRWLSPMFPGDGKTPYSTVGFNWMLTDYVVEDASYFALRDIVIGYTLPEKFAKRIKMNSLRVYFSGQNLYFHAAKGYRGINAEARYTGGPYSSALVDGYQRGGYPMPKTVIFGIDVNF